jgi:hypothetical protein
MEVDDSKYDDFGKLSVKLQTAKGEIHNETFSLVGKNNEVNEGALRAWSYFARTCLGNYQANEIDTQDIVGCYITTNVRHETYTRTKGDRAGEEAKAVRLSDYSTASGFAVKADAAKGAMNEPEEDLDDFLNS